MRSFKILALLASMGICGAVHAEDSVDLKTFTAKRGQKILFLQAFFYDPAGCKPAPAQVPLVWAQPKIGKVVTEILDDAPLPGSICAGKKGNLVRLFFESGTQPGEDSFKIYMPREYASSGYPYWKTFKYKVQ